MYVRICRIFEQAKPQIFMKFYKKVYKILNTVYQKKVLVTSLITKLRRFKVNKINNNVFSIFFVCKSDAIL